MAAPLTWPESLGEALPTILLAALKVACMSFPVGTGLGWDKMHPRAIVRLSDEALQLLIRIFLLAEQAGRWPDCVGIIL
eukprot:11695867-Karenia_brevis.AAC.1